MKLADKLIEDLMRFTDSAIKTAFEKQLKKFEFDAITIDDVASEPGGDTVITFGDDEDQMIEVLFTNDEDDGPLAIILDPERDLLDDEEDELDIIELGPLEPDMMDFGQGQMGIDLVNLGWLTETAMQAILTVGDLIDTQTDTGDTDNDDADRIEERSVVVVRGGKKVRLPLVRKRRRRRLSAKQKVAIRRGAKKRKQKARSIARKRKKSLKIRKRSGLKRQKPGSRVKTQGTSTSKSFRGA